MMVLQRYLFFSMVWLIVLYAGCSEINEDHPQTVIKRCGVCHDLPPKDSNTVDAIHFFHVEIDSLHCGECHLNYDTITGWTLDSLHRNGIAGPDTSADQCHLCHDYQDCSNPSCHNSPPNNMANAISYRVHNVHVTREKFGCDSCHKGYNVQKKKFPKEIHNNMVTDVVFNLQSMQSPPTYDPTTHTCYNIYCHGANVIGGRRAIATLDSKPQDSTQCSFCHNTDTLLVKGKRHSNPVDHIALFPECLNCHKLYSMKSFTTNDSIHMNGVVDLVPGEKCDACHSEPHVVVP